MFVPSTCARQEFHFPKTMVKIFEGWVPAPSPMPPPSKPATGFINNDGPSLMHYRKNTATGTKHLLLYRDLSQWSLLLMSKMYIVDAALVGPYNLCYIEVYVIIGNVSLRDNPKAHSSWSKDLDYFVPNSLEMHVACREAPTACIIRFFVASHSPNVWHATGGVSELSVNSKWSPCLDKAANIVQM